MWFSLVVHDVSFLCFFCHVVFVFFFVLQHVGYDQFCWIKCQIPIFDFFLENHNQFSYIFKGTFK